MRNHRAIGSQSKGSLGRASNLLSLVSFLACFYVAGRLYQDARIRSDLIRLAGKQHKRGESVVSLDETVRVLDFREMEKKVATLSMELAAARSKGYVSELGTANATGTAAAGGATAKRLLAVIGVNTGFGQRPRRDSIRNTWMPKGEEALKALATEKGLVIRFVVGRSANRGDSSDKAIDEEAQETKDFFILESHVEGYDELPLKTQAYYAEVIKLWDADFYLKVDDDVYLNTNNLATMLTQHIDKPRVYVGCMKSGEVYTESNQRWHEPEWWKFGDAKVYFRHATGQVYGLSKTVAQYVSINRDILHRYRNEDVSLGSWMLGLDVEHVDERLLCCSQGDCAGHKKEGTGCVAVFDWQCSGLCDSVERMKKVHGTCG